MLRKFYVNNFRLFLNVSFCPREINLLIGRNNSGKTTLARAVHFLGLTARAPLNTCVDLVAGARGGLINFGFARPTMEFQIQATLPFENESLDFEYALTLSVPLGETAAGNIEVETEILKLSGGRFQDVTLLENTRNGVRLLHELDYLAGQVNRVETTAPRDVTMLNRLYDLRTNARANAFKRYLASWQYYDLSPEAMRGTEHDPLNEGLHADGRNLASVVYQMKTANERAYRKVLEHLKKADPDVDLINFRMGSDRDVFMFFEDHHGHAVPARSVSAGTLRFLAIACVLTQPSGPGDSVITIEEPENGLFVGLYKEILDMALTAPTPAQVLLTTHSPYFIDLFDNRLDSVFYVKRDGYQASLVQPAPDKVKEWLKDFPLGEQHFREMLG